MNHYIAVAVALALLGSAAAHHSPAAFDARQPVTVNGTIAKVEWTSPHARIYVATVDTEGATVTWDFELPSPVTLTRRGWMRNTLGSGDAVTVTGILARNHPHIAIATGITNSKGERLFSGAAKAVN